MTRKIAFQSILFPVDFSNVSEATAAHVHGLAQSAGAKVTLLHVLPWLSGWYSTTELHPVIPGDKTLHDAEADSVDKLKSFRDKYFGDIACSTCIRSGAVAETITDTARDLGSDLIMMPTRGLGPSRRFLIGSTTAKVLHDATCAVWTSPHLQKLEPFSGYHHLLCTIDRDEVIPEFILQSVRLASCFESKLSFVTALPRIAGGSGESKKGRELAKEFPQAALKKQLNPDIDYTVYKETGEIGNVVKRLVEQHKANLVVINRGHLQHPFGKLRTHAFEIVLESPCPVISLCISAPEHAGVNSDRCELEQAL